MKYAKSIEKLCTLSQNTFSLVFVVGVAMCVCTDVEVLDPPRHIIITYVLSQVMSHHLSCACDP
jgi:hypothetical protein